jgi:large subunit ribosomal protein L12
MEYVYAAMLLHKAGQKVDEAAVKKVLEAASVTVDDTRVKALVAALDGVNIDEAIEKAAATPVAASAGGATGGEAAAEKKADEGAAAAGLGALFG